MNSALRIEIALRAAQLAKSVLELVGMSPEICGVSLDDIEIQTAQIRSAIQKGKTR